MCCLISSSFVRQVQSLDSNDGNDFVLVSQTQPISKTAPGSGFTIATIPLNLESNVRIILRLVAIFLHLTEKGSTEEQLRDENGIALNKSEYFGKRT